MKPTLAIGVVTICGCAEPARQLSADHALVGKCAFAASQTTDIRPGDPFVYVVRDVRDESLFVVTGIADVVDPLTDTQPRQAVDAILPARRVPPARLEFGNLALDRTGPADHFIGMNDESGAVFVSIGTTYETNRAYPLCAFRP